MPPEEEDESIDELPLPGPVVLRRGKHGRVIGVPPSFIGGGRHSLPLRHPFVNSLQSLAALVGISGYFLSSGSRRSCRSSPKVSAYGWAMKEGKAKMGLMNFSPPTSIR